MIIRPSSCSMQISASVGLGRDKRRQASKGGTVPSSYSANSKSLLLRGDQGSKYPSIFLTINKSVLVNSAMLEEKDKLDRIAID
jgi:hypothetical protein